MIDAHGIGGQADLPIPLSLAVAGAVAALVLSFTILIVAWRRPRYTTPGGRPAPGALSRLVQSTGFRVVLRAAGLVGFLYAVMTAVFGEDRLTNPFFGIVYVWLWVGVIFASVLFGPVWRAISPMRTISAGLARLSGADPHRGVYDYPARLGHWPAALGLLSFVWLELVSPAATSLGAVRLWCAVYVAVMLVGGALFGSRFHENADPFEVWSTLAAKVSPWAVADGRLVLRSPLANLATVPPRHGLVAVVAVLFGSTAFDSFRESERWVKYYQGHETLTKFQLDNLALVAFCLLAGLIFVAGTMLTGVGPDQDRRSLPRHFAHSMVPILVGYLVAHYLTLFLDQGTQTLAYASDPFGRGDDFLGTAGVSPTYWFSYHATLLASIKVIGVVVGHVAAAVSAHDRALTVLPRHHQVTGQLPLLFAMVGFTAGGLYLLFSA
ncbi:hypothetical protein KUV85_08785 [Nocardioides panacisoli]|uniref:hypothetical protein n=1 Tax=Nocardioides panacisoli TaxID=627624 RepID=UPI001C62844D|nr:hypothetical protein [Nocardioides panacisoli]QYJ02435.1 hypothetical protein KUV85_08785 [Nocardioides panacisoli]